MTEAKTSGYDMVIAGAGPAGLAAGIAARKCGRRAVILEKGESAGPLPRGEGIHRYPLLDEVLGMDFWEKDCYRMDCSVVYHSPNDLHTTRKQGTRDIFFFEWRRLIDRLVDRAQKAGVEIIYNAEVLGPIEGNENSCRGLRYRFEQKDERLIYGKAVLACDGYNSVLGRHYGIDYRTINCPMVKCIADNTPVLSSREPDLQFYLIGSGDLSYAPDIPPCVVYAFPIGGRKMELGLMLRMGKDAPKGVRIPDPKELMTVWGHLKKDYPGLSPDSPF